MMHAILRVKKLKTFGAVALSGAHTFRERLTPNADSTRTPLNKAAGAKSTRSVLAALRALLPAKRRKDAVLCLEYLITASPGFFEGGKSRTDYFSQSLAWLRKKHGSQNVIAANVHVDETTPHLVAYVLPLTSDGRLSAKDFVGGPAKLSKLQTDFHSAVGSGFGLTRGQLGSKATHLSISKFYGSLNLAPALPKIAVVDHLAAAVGIETENMTTRREAEQVLRRRASVAGEQTLTQMQASLEGANAELNIQRHNAQRDAKLLKRLKDEQQIFKESHETLIQRLRTEIAGLREELRLACVENGKWANYVRELVSRFQPRRLLGNLTSPATTPERKNRYVP
jgi:hypothetical protein